MFLKNFFLRQRHIPKDTIALSLVNLSLSLISLKNLVAFFDVSNMQSWFLSSILLVGVFSSVHIFRFDKWSFFSFHIFAMGVCVAALGQLLERPTSLNYYSLLACIVYGALGSLILHRHIDSAYFNPNQVLEPNSELSVNASLGAGDSILSVNIIDISHTGCFLSSPKKLHMGQSVHLCIHINPQLKFRAKCRVMRESQQPQGYGLKFEGLDHRDFSCSKLAMSKIMSKLYKKQTFSEKQVSA